MYKELKAEILKWLLEHEKEWQRVNAWEGLPKEVPTEK